MSFTTINTFIILVNLRLCLKLTEKMQTNLSKASKDPRTVGTLQPLLLSSSYSYCFFVYVWLQSIPLISSCCYTLAWNSSDLLRHCLPWYQRSHSEGFGNVFPPPDSRWALNNESVCTHLFHNHIEGCSLMLPLIHWVIFQGFLFFSYSWFFVGNKSLKKSCAWQTAVFCLEWIIYCRLESLAVCLSVLGMKDILGANYKRPAYK